MTSRLQLYRSALFDLMAGGNQCSDPYTSQHYNHSSHRDSHSRLRCNNVQPAIHCIVWIALRRGTYRYAHDTYPHYTRRSVLHAADWAHIGQGSWDMGLAHFVSNVFQKTCQAEPVFQARSACWLCSVPHCRAGNATSKSAATTNVTAVHISV